MQLATEQAGKPDGDRLPIPIPYFHRHWDIQPSPVNRGGVLELRET